MHFVGLWWRWVWVWIKLLKWGCVLWKEATEMTHTCITAPFVLSTCLTYAWILEGALFYVNILFFYYVYFAFNNNNKWFFSSSRFLPWKIGM